MAFDRENGRPQRGTTSAGHTSTMVGPGKQTLVEQLYGVQMRHEGSAAISDGASVKAAAATGVASASQPLPHLDRIQAAFGLAHDLSGVQAHVGGDAMVACDTIGASAYAAGDRVAFREHPDLHTAAHEAAHVVQQASGVRLKDGVGQSDDGYELQADAIADRVVRGQPATDLLGEPTTEHRIARSFRTAQG